jgi:hypothetical protein
MSDPNTYDLEGPAELPDPLFMLAAYADTEPSDDQLRPVLLEVFTHDGMLISFIEPVVGTSIDEIASAALDAICMTDVPRAVALLSEKWIAADDGTGRSPSERESAGDPTVGSAVSLDFITPGQRRGWLRFEHRNDDGTLSYDPPVEVHEFLDREEFVASALAHLAVSS